MALVVFGGTALVTSAIYWIIMRLATGERARAFKGVSPGLLSPLGVMFGLLVAFIAAQVWGDVERANVSVNREASSLRAVIMLSRPFPTDIQARMLALVKRYIKDAQQNEWPAMAHQRVTLAMVPAGLADALQLAIELPATGEGQIAAQREIVANLDNALDARRQRILVSRGEVNIVKWFALIFEGMCTLTAIAIVHSDSRATARVAMTLFSAAMGACIFLLVAADRPFTGELSVRPTPLLNVAPDSSREN
jgi:hypothetical protein